jgi:hypothetical protein
MRVFGYELKKLLNWKLLLVLILFSGLFYKLCISFYLNVTYCGSGGIGEIRASQVLLQKYGTTINKSEEKDLEAYIAGEKAKLNGKISGLKDFKAEKITDVDQLSDLLEPKMPNGKAQTDLYEKLTAELDETGTPAYWDSPKLQTGPYYLYLEEKARAESFRMYPEQTAELQKSGISYRSEPTVFPYPIQSSWSGLVNYLSILLLITAAVLTAPYLVRENRSGVLGLAYTAEKGRNLLGTQFASAVAAAFLLVLVQFAVFFAAYLTGLHQIDLQFFGCFVSNEVTSKTFGQEVLANGLMIFFLTFGFVFFSFAVSKFCRSYVTLLAVEIPVLFLAGKLALWLLQNSFAGKRILVCAACFLVPLAVCLYLVHREKAVDILT